MDENWLCRNQASSYATLGRAVGSRNPGSCLGQFQHDCKTKPAACFDTCPIDRHVSSFREACKHLHDRCGSVHEQRGCAVFPRQILWDLAPLLRRRVGSLGSVPQSPDSVVANMWLGRVSAFVQQQVPRPRVFLTVAVAESLLPRGVSSEGRLEIQVYQLVDHVGVIF